MDIARHALRVLRVFDETILDGEGLRLSIYLSGCHHRCPGCHNPDSWLASRGRLLDEAYLSELIEKILSNELLDGVTLSGGDPFYNPAGLCELLERIKGACGCSIWCYTGYYIEELLEDPYCRQALSWIDTLVDGPYVESLMSPHLAFRGSSNQRILKGPWDEETISRLGQSLVSSRDGHWEE